MAKGKLFVISGPSGTGKGTIINEILKANDDIRLSISMTTRQPREGEQHGVQYFFATREEFEALIAEDGFIEYADVYGNYYGTPKKAVNDWMESGQDVLLEIDVQGAIQVKEKFPEAILLFILPPSLIVLRARLEGRRTDTQEVINKRMANAAKEIALVGHYDYAVVNNKLEVAVEEAVAIIKGQRCKLNEEIAAEIVGRY
ncbi:MAG: guanylate kinase [Eubacterium sp.]|nr:guanylate kinase [Candidatus Colimonas fimequi]